MIGEGSLDLLISIIISILVVRVQGDSALGIFSYFLSFYLFAGFISEFGITKYLEREIGFENNIGIRNKKYRQSYDAVILFSIFCSALIIITSFYSASLTVLNENFTAYIIIAFTIPLQNINRLRIAEAIQGKKIILLPVSEGGMNLKTTNINDLIQTMGVKSLANSNK